jgi:RNA polymerase sigma-70 factor (ECF subfamily)
MVQLSSIRTDGWLISRVRDGDLDALGELFERHKALVYRTALAVIHDEVAADDVLQDVFLRVYTYAYRIDTTVPLEPWLYRVTVNQAYSWITHAKRLFRTLQAVLGRWLSSPEWQSGPDVMTEEREKWQHVQRAIDALAPSHRSVVVLHYLEGLSLEDIAHVLEIPEGTVKSRLYYARKKLRKAMKEHERRLVPELVYDFT